MKACRALRSWASLRTGSGSKAILVLERAMEGLDVDKIREAHELAVASLTR